MIINPFGIAMMVLPNTYNKAINILNESTDLLSSNENIPEGNLLFENKDSKKAKFKDVIMNQDYSIK